MAVNVSAWVWTLPLPVFDKMVLLELADHCDPSGFCYPSQNFIAKRTGIARETVNRIVKRLEGQGLLTIEHHFIKGAQRANRYSLSVGITIHLSDAGSHLGVTEDHTPCDAESHHIETSVETPKETSLASSPTQGEIPIKISDVQEKFKSNSKQTIFDRFEPKPKKCGQLWKDCWGAANSAGEEHGFQAELLVKDFSLLNNARKRIPEADFCEIVWQCMHNWLGFTKHCESHAGAFNSPLIPQIAYFVKFIEAAGNWAKPVKSIAQPLTNKPAPSKPIPKAKPKAEKAPPISLAELLAMNEDEE